MRKAAVTFPFRLRNRIKICVGTSVVQGIRTVSSKLFVSSKRQGIPCLFAVFLAILFRLTSLSVYWRSALLLSFFFTLRWKVSGRRLVAGYRRFGTIYRLLRIKHILPSTRQLIWMHERK